MAFSPPYRAREIIIKRPDGQMLTRADVQFDFLTHVFSDTKPVFTNPFAPESQKDKKVAFADLYLTTLRSSARVTRTLVDLLNSNREFAIEMAKLAFLINVGRLDTTVSFFPETKTAQRTYHPIPCLQRTPEDHHDGPRLKNYLKWVSLPSEDRPPKLPADVLARLNAGIRPPTHVFNLLFCLSQNAGLHSVVHLSKDKSIHYLDLFSTLPLSSSHRARTFLWYMYHYLEGGPQNPFDDEYSRQHPGKAPRISSLGTFEAGKENVDTPEEIRWAKERTKIRYKFLKELRTGQEYQNKTKSESPIVTEYNVRRRWNTRFVPPLESGQESCFAASSSHIMQENMQHTPVFEHYISPEHEQTRAKSQRKSGLGGKLREPTPFVPQHMTTTFQHYIPPTQPTLRQSNHGRAETQAQGRVGGGGRRVSSHLSQPPQIPHREDSAHLRQSHPRVMSSPSQGYDHFDEASSDKMQVDVDPRITKPHRKSAVSRAFDKMLNDRNNSEDELGDVDDGREYGQRLAILSRLRGRPPTPPTIEMDWR